ncbi:MAG: S8 family serine peptidase [Roseibium sp.]|uniref:S8 family serine peptidase n=1 Tax=Roseibium sp. TaxID=1936156 RepID=UPI003297F9AD
MVSQSNKERTFARLSRLEALPDILPSQPGVPRVDVSVAVRSGAFASSDAQTRARLDVPAEDVFASATSFLSRTCGYEDQVARFAEAGMLFFYPRRDLLDASLDERRARGGNGAVSRVFVDDGRLLLETGRVLIGFDPETREADRKLIMDRAGLLELAGSGLPQGVWRALVLDGTPAVEKCLNLLDENKVTFAEPDFIEQVGGRLTPDDPLFTQQWHHKAIDCEAAWDMSLGTDVRVAMIDNGFKTDHGDLAFAAGSGFFRTTSDFQDADFVPGTLGMPEGDHGTATAGMIAAIKGNGFGGCGVAFESKLMGISCLNDQVGTQSTLGRAIAYAARPDLEGRAEAGADVICCSLGPDGAVWRMGETLRLAIEFAATQGRGGLGCPVFWASTNGNYPIGADEVCSHPDTIAIGRSTEADTDDSSGYGRELEFLATGARVRLPSGNGGYGFKHGTSFAAPCAAGVAALMLSVNSQLTARELRQMMRNSCDKIGTLPYILGRNARFGWGRISARRAVEAARAGV